MLLYPASILFRVTRAIEFAFSDLRLGRRLAAADSVEMEQFEKIVAFPYWAGIEAKFPL